MRQKRIRARASWVLPLVSRGAGQAARALVRIGTRFGGRKAEGGEREGWIPQNVQEKLEKPLIRWGKEGATGLAEGILRPSKMIGLGANILLDPTTYISFGATTAARTAAGTWTRQQPWDSRSCRVSWSARRPSGNCR